ncbi:hypothetical protein [Bradyrhizobium sp. WSM471]|uniref:hypothetical protein n=1 Tax=Bradyrhizobium sp. WSM471 TaxID=319017 RepID=UPI00024D33CF|nr:MULTISPECIES: hypothetical protein [Bradyrhizobium]EHR05418.1 hypothetical protein Bra471DRAFT_06236 [Bradyrhizobium sp. WSM471]UFW40531.1 hypothetical protein BcanWSM471_30650 [Bradyrhizobium canariense]
MLKVEPTLENLASHIQRQDRSLKAMRWSVLGATIMAAAAIISSQWHATVNADAVKTKSLSVETIALRNGTGKIVALISSTSDGTPHISLFDSREKVRLSIGLRQDGAPSVSLLDTEQGHRAVLSLNDHQDASLTMYNAAKLPRATLAVDSASSGHMVLFGTGGGLNLSALDGRVQWTPVDGAVQNVQTKTESK